MAAIFLQLHCCAEISMSSKPVWHRIAQSWLFVLRFSRRSEILPRAMDTACIHKRILSLGNRAAPCR